MDFSAWGTWVYQATRDGIVYDIVSKLIAPMIITGMLYLVGKQLKWFVDRRTETVVLGCAFVVVFVALFVVTPRTSSPQLAGKIENMIFGPINSDRDIISVSSINIVNSGNMQSIVKNWNVTLTINGMTYQGSFIVPPPSSFTFKVLDPPPGSASAVTFYGDNDLLNKTQAPIPLGGQISGLLFVLFSGLDAKTLRGGEQYVVRYEDALSKSYEMRGTTNAQRQPVTMAAGIHADLMCPAVDPRKQPLNYSTPGGQQN